MRFSRIGVGSRDRPAFGSRRSISLNRDGGEDGCVGGCSMDGKGNLAPKLDVIDESHMMGHQKVAGQSSARKTRKTRKTLKSRLITYERQTQAISKILDPKIDPKIHGTLKPRAYRYG